MIIRILLNTKRSQIRLDFNYPIQQNSLRSDLSGWQYYKVAYEGLLDDRDQFKKFIHFEFVYSSACPCSSDLAEHARETRQVYSIPHSQRSTARISLEIASEANLFIEQVHAMALEALKTETQVMVKREDEQAFAELNGAYPKFVEDAARLLFAELIKMNRCGFSYPALIWNHCIPTMLWQLFARVSWWILGCY